MELLIKDKIDFSPFEHSRSRNFFSELLLAKVLKEVSCNAVFSEPDLIIKYNVNNQNISFAIACKMLESISNLEKILSKAKKQLRKIAQPTIKGIIALDLSIIFNNNFLRTLKFNNEITISNLLADKLHEFWKNNLNIFKKCIDNKVIGLIIFCASSHIIQEESIPILTTGTQINFYPLRSNKSSHTEAFKSLSVMFSDLKN